MALLILAAFIVVPVTEIAVFIQVGGWIGLWPTLALVLLTAMAGTALLRHQGLGTLMRAQQSLEEGRFPAAELFDGVCLAFAGALLLTPGFVTDGLGLLLFVPRIRGWLRGLVLHRLVAAGRVQTFNEGAEGGPRTTIIEADYEIIEPDDRDRRP